MEESKTKTPQPTQQKKGILSRMRAWMGRRSPAVRWMIRLAIIILIPFLFSERIYIGDLLIGIRKYGPILLLLAGLFWGIYKAFSRKSKIIGGIATAIIAAVIFIAPAFAGLMPWDMYDYMAGYSRYQTLSKIEIAELPETQHEAIQSPMSVRTAAEQQLQETETISPPLLVRDGNRYVYAMAKEPSPNYWLQCFNQHIESVYQIPAEHSTLQFTGENQTKVNFNIGSTLVLSRNIHTATMRALPFWKLFTTEAGEPRMITDNEGKVIQVVPLITWKGHGIWGIFFPQPEFGGVHIIRQHDGEVSNPLQFVKRALVGVGETYNPEQVTKIAYLQNQNLMPHAVTLSIAKSFRFQNGFTAPMPFNHTRDTRVPEIEGFTELPITTHCEMSAVQAKARNELYEYIGLEPFDTTKHGLTTSLFIPSDGEMLVYIYQHGDNGFPGMSAVPGKAREDKKEYDWQQSKVAYVRPFFRKINGKTHPFWLFSIVSRQTAHDSYMASANGQVGLFDPVRGTKPLWLDATKPETWLQQIDSAVAQK